MPGEYLAGMDLERWIQDHFSAQTSERRDPTQNPLDKIIIHNDDRIGCLRLLDKMNISRMSLFPDLDGAARYINALWELGFRTSLGRY